MPREIEYSSLPRPPRLKRAGIIEFISGTEKFGFRCTAAIIRNETCDDGRVINWLHFEGAQLHGSAAIDEESGFVSCLIPAGYVTSIKPDPALQGEPRRDAPQLISPGVIKPVHSDPSEALGVDVVDRELRKLMSQ